ncbi:Acyl-CoA hydrolase [Tindallia magadiensis]|uniref:Acyl-CoA hydrolase n=1 Tax=Tindallia magadiensis TaxID=69895 RepID=A0A1I3H0R8_9FIRM|nr:acetyl-CoA hydrolase/transferase C-terminal domain-containing protein [Tindallia magadiensis]SFI29299.1 Acyl-CoA hydrolase [Tindallia magadiensis]
MLFKEMYHARKNTIDECLQLIKSGDHLICGLAASEPMTILESLHRLSEQNLDDILLTNTLPMGAYEFITNPKYSQMITVSSWFYTPVMRKSNHHPHITFQPNHLHRAMDKRLMATAGRRPVLLTTCAPMDRHGYLSLSIGNTYEKQLIQSGEALVILEVSSQFPRTFGDNQIHISQVDALVETERAIPCLPVNGINSYDERIGAFIAERIEDGSTIQLGIGGIPNAVAKALEVRNNLGIHTEMFTDGMVDLIEKGAVTNSRKTLRRDQSVCTFALGSEKLYRFLDDNPSVLFEQGCWTNNPAVIAQNYKMVSINTTIEVDFGGQCCSESLGYQQFSGTGGQADTAIGAQGSTGGKSFIALYSTAQITGANGEKKNISKIVPTLKPGAVVSLSRNDVDYVVTEYGVASLRGESIASRTKQLINIAHPDFREELLAEADKMNFL